jgi:phosphoribosyl-ATP pyrophosphohydrolase
VSVGGIGTTLEGLYAVLVQRGRDLPEGSYTAKLLSEPDDKLLSKITEEAGELILAARDGDPIALRHEVADILYHVLVVMVREGMTLQDLAAELEVRRH